ncbi:glycerol-3-phosphate dehydrogenase [Thecamonas trahens ATCC 50062]|uniref:Glycerol-3-phosphate dehydrogenase n=1 Tax=Thecamonas trahens ATCC 50062 TaxID=461836 RepID=A0A0L0DFI9_THETB|nr:glycerol-3-phosphate dehydrogenase [Thecamonas trahens ATCC 50062]KNC50931.1 glycerol-3-phosphate dehydrogenase [Thecamonas trahens ATCC 50062]|eukprot:XP_013756629.1 glycerol-3-phosphate dehydrogenase [Thecamonas trahens ATCC 50062]
MLRSTAVVSATWARLGRALSTSAAVGAHVSMADVPPREEMIDRLRHTSQFDMLVIGGGATGVGVALDAITRGYSVALVERGDFGCATSSKSTKLIHGGVRYLEKAFWNADYGQYKLVREALKERSHWMNVAPHISRWLPIMLPLYSWWKVPYMYAGVKAYDLVAGLPPKRSYFLSKRRALEQFPMLQADGLKGAVVYYDGVNDDTRMNLAIALTAAAKGAALGNYVDAEKILKDADGKVTGVVATDRESQSTFEIRAKVVIAAAGPFIDSVRRMEDPDVEPMVQPSSGTHIILPSFYAPSSMGLIDPSTSDGRVIFFLPWLGHTVCGTTDAPCPVDRNPAPTEEEVSWILNEVQRYLTDELKVRRRDVLSAWKGIRPLVSDPTAADTQEIRREHVVAVSPGGMVLVGGGKWTTYREMAQDAVDKALEVSGLRKKTAISKNVKLIGAEGWTPNLHIQLIQKFGIERDVAVHLARTYGSESFDVARMAAETNPTGQRWPLSGKRLVPGYPYLESEVRVACAEFARSATDVLARRTRLAFLNVEAAREAVPRVIEIMADELGWDNARIEKEYRRVDVMFSGEFGGPARIPIRSIDKASSEEIRDAFAAIDVDGSGYVDANDLQNLATALGKPLSKNELDAALADMDPTGEGKCSYESFEWWWYRQTKSAESINAIGLVSGRTALDSYP